MPGAAPLTVRLEDLRVDVSLSGVAQGDLLIRGASKWNNLAAGTSGYFLKSNGPGANPSWAAVSVSPGGSSGQLQYNNAGAFGGLASTAVATSGNLITVTAQAATDVPFLLKGTTSQSGDYLQCKEVGNTSVFRVDASGGITAGSSVGGSGSCTSNFLYGVTKFGYVGSATWQFQSAVLYGLSSNTSQAIQLGSGGGYVGGGGASIVSIWDSSQNAGKGALRCGQPTNATVALLIRLHATTNADPFQITQNDGTTVVYKVNKDGNPTAKSTYFFEDTNGYISRTSAGNTMSFSASSATDHMKLSAQYFDVLTAYGIRLKAASDSTDGELCASNKGGNSGAGLGLLLHGGDGSYSATPTAGGYVKLYGGGGAAGNTNGGAVYVFGGAKFGSGLDGDTILGYTGSAARGNLSLFGAGSFGGGDNVVFIANATTVPASDPTGGGILYCEAGALKYRGSSGTITTLGAA